MDMGPAKRLNCWAYRAVALYFNLSAITATATGTVLPKALALEFCDQAPFLQMSIGNAGGQLHHETEFLGNC